MSARLLEERNNVLVEEDERDRRETSDSIINLGIFVSTLLLREIPFFLRRF